jgi:hypothetical protein
MQLCFIETISIGQTLKGNYVNSILKESRYDKLGYAVIRVLKNARVHVFKMK